MNAQGVLAVWGEAIADYDSGVDLEFLDKLREARATVAELIASRERDLEVFERAAAQLDQAANMEKAKTRRMLYRTAQDMCNDRIAILRAALASAGGAQ